MSIRSKLSFGVSMSLCRGGLGIYRQERDPGRVYLAALEDFTAFARQNGFLIIELVTLSIIHAGILRRIHGEIRAAIKGFDSVVLHLPLGEVNTAAFHPGIRHASMEETKKHIDLCQQIGIKHAVMHPGAFGAMPDIYALLSDLTTASAIAGVREIAEHCRTRSVQLSVENLHRNEPFFQRPEDFDVFAGMGVGIVLDTVHAFESGIDPVAFIERFGPHLTEVHLTDGIQSDPVAHCALGAGEVDLGSVLDRLERNAFRGPVVIEVESKADLLASMKFLRSGGYL